MREMSLNCVYELAKKDPRVVFIGSDLGPGTLSQMQKEMPERFFMEGVSEAHIIGMAAGLAKEGYIPYVNTIATFLTRRCFEQVAIDLCLHNLPVRLIANGGGVVYAPLGPTHLATEDIAILRSLPNMSIVAVTDADEMRRFMDKSLDHPGPLYIRLGKGSEPIISDTNHPFEIGKAIVMREPGDVLLISTGIMAHAALQAAEALTQSGINCGVLNMHTVKPLDEEAILHYAKRVKLLVTLEEHTLIGGLGSAVIETLVDKAFSSMPPVLRMGLPDRFTEEYGSQESMLENFGLGAESIVKSVKTKLNECVA